ncbi:MAG: dinitrogenase iron-molybdenum cofactor [Firmicutes bacterium]|nr:dinitrogenase iron-molybdenum cofactor [Bacillota bacterium]
MKIAIASDGKNVSGHFGHCKGFEIIEVENSDIKSKNFLENPGHKPGFLPKFLSEKNIDVIISGGMGAKAQVLFNENNIKVVTGAKGEVDSVVKNYIKGNLTSTDEVCNRHEHEGDCH